VGGEGSVCVDLAHGCKCAEFSYSSYYYYYFEAAFDEVLVL
jgi:hypothetical protein